MIAVGTGVKGVHVGERRGVGWIADSCRRCVHCLRGEENICLQGYTGLIVAGKQGGRQADVSEGAMVSTVKTSSTCMASAVLRLHLSTCI